MATDFEGKKLVVIGGASGMGLKTAEDVIAAGGSAVIVGRPGQKLDDAVANLSRSGSAWSIAADLTDWDQVVEAQKQLAENHSDATLLVNSAGFVRPKPFLDHEVADYDSYHDLNRATFFLTQTVVRGMIAGGQGGAIVNVGAHVGAPGPRRDTVVGILDGQGGPARPHAQPGHRARRRGHPCKRRGSRRHQYAPFRLGLSRGPAGRHAGADGRPAPAWPSRHPAGPGLRDHLPPLVGLELDHGRHPQRRRRGHGRPQLDTPTKTSIGPARAPRSAHGRRSDSAAADSPAGARLRCSAA